MYMLKNTQKSFLNLLIKNYAMLTGENDNLCYKCPDIPKDTTRQINDKVLMASFPVDLGWEMEEIFYL